MWNVHFLHKLAIYSQKMSHSNLTLQGYVNFNACKDFWKYSKFKLQVKIKIHWLKNCHGCQDKNVQFFFFSSVVHLKNYNVITWTNALIWTIPTALKLSTNEFACNVFWFCFIKINAFKECLWPLVYALWSAFDR